jgi:hypothetical protein
MKKALSERQLFERSITEEHVFNACRALLELNGARVYRIVERIPWGRKKSEPGLPDCLGWWALEKHEWHELHDGRVFFIEFKKPGGKKRPAQIRWIEQARADGVIAFFADSVEAMVKGFAEFGIKLKGA